MGDTSEKLGSPAHLIWNPASPKHHIPQPSLLAVRYPCTQPCRRLRPLHASAAPHFPRHPIPPPLCLLVHLPPHLPPIHLESQPPLFAPPPSSPPVPLSWVMAAGGGHCSEFDAVQPMYEREPGRAQVLRGGGGLLLKCRNGAVVALMPRAARKKYVKLQRLAEVAFSPSPSLPSLTT